MNLFAVYRGQVLEVDELLHIAMKNLFPELDLPSAYRDMDAWILQAPKSKRPRDQRKFVINWLRRNKRRENAAEYVVSDGVRCRVTAADRRTGRVR